jgi:hypothetical protein
MAERISIPSKAEGLLERDLNDEIVVLTPEGKVLHSFAGTARFIWERIDGRRSIGDLLSAITEEYQVEPEVAQRDLEAFVSKLQGLALIALR